MLYFSFFLIFYLKDFKCSDKELSRGYLAFIFSVTGLGVDNSQKIRQTIRRKFVDSSESIPRQFRDNSKTIRRQFEENSETIRRGFVDISSTIRQTIRSQFVDSSQVFVDNSQTTRRKFVRQFVVNSQVFVDKSETVGRQFGDKFGENSLRIRRQLVDNSQTIKILLANRIIML